MDCSHALAFRNKPNAPIVSGTPWPRDVRHSPGQETICQVIAVTAVEPHAVAIRACDNPEAIVLDFMQPQVAGGQLVGLCGKVRRDEAGREGAHTQHNAHS